MRLGAAEKTLPYESFAQQKFDVFLSPVPRGEGLQEHHNFLEVHLQQLVGPLDQECCADVEVEM